MNENKREFGIGTIIFLVIFIGIFVGLASVMGLGNLFNTILKTAYDVFISTVLYILAMNVIMGAIGALLTEFGVVALLQWLINPLMKPLYGMPGASSLGVVTTFLSDNPAILALPGDPRVRKYFRKYQTPALCNLGTSFGMGMIVCTFMIGLGSNYLTSVVCGFLGCVIGSIVSTRLMLFQSKRIYQKNGTWEEMQQYEENPDTADASESGETAKKEKKGLFSRVMNSILEGGKLGWEVCHQTTAGVVFICTLVMILTFGPGVDATGAACYTGAAYEGIQLLPMLGNLISPVTKLLFGFADGSNIAFPITALGAVGAAISLVPEMIANGLAGGNEVAVFTAMGMCFSGYLSTHVSMMDSLNHRELISTAIISHTIGGICAGIAAHYLFLIVG